MDRTHSSRWFGLNSWVAVLMALWFAGSAPMPVAADAASPAAELHVCASGCSYSSVQTAVDAASTGNVIKIAQGTYTDVFTRSNQVQGVFISKSLTLQGGFTSGDWSTYNPVAHPTTLDARLSARVLYISGNISVTVQGLRITGGQPHAWSGGTDYFADGGGIYIVTATATFQDNIIFSNTVGGPGLGGTILKNGAGIYASYGTVTLNNNQVLSNTATGDGAGLYLWHSGATLAGNAFSANRAGDNGGGLYLVSSPATLTGNTVAQNQANSTISGSGRGGGLYVEDSVATLSGNTVLSNTASGYGGGLYLATYTLFGTHNATLSSNIFVSNTANYGGGLYLQPGTTSALSEPPPVAVADNTARANSATWDGGGLMLNGGGEGVIMNHNTVAANTTQFDGGGVSISGNAVTLTNNLISTNRSYSTGGGLALNNSSALLCGNTITGNVAGPSGGGGGLYLYKSPASLSGNLILSNTAAEGAAAYLDGSNAIFTNTVIADNRADPGTTAYAISIYRSSLRFLHTTLARNTGLAALYLTSWSGTPSTIALTNTILVSHSTGIQAATGNTATVAGVLWYSNTANYSGTVYVTYAYTGAPKFALDGYHILSGSLAIDHGVNAGVLADIDGQARPYGPLPDLGADEWALLLNPKVYMPVVRK